MSAPLMQRLAVRQLPAHLKSVLLVLANYAREDGTGARPSLATLATWTGRSLPRTRVLMRDLRRGGLIVVTRAHTSRRPAEYALNLDVIEALPSLKRDPWQLDLFPAESGAHSLRAQGDAAIGAGLREFSTVSTGIHRSPTIPQGDRPRSPIRVLDPGTKILVPDARARTATAT